MAAAALALPALLPGLGLAGAAAAPCRTDCATQPSPGEQTFSGTLGRKSPTATHAVTTGSGTLTARLQFASGETYTMTVSDGSRTLDTRTGPSVLAGAAAVAPGQQLIQLSGRAGSKYTLRVTYPPVGSDVTRPSVAITTPADGSTVGGAVAIAGSASDDTGVTSVTVTVGSITRQASGTASWSTSIDSTQLADGTHTVTATAADAAGNTTSTSRSITVSNRDSTPPSLTVSTPAAGAVLTGPAVVTGVANDDTALSYVEVRLGSGAWHRATGLESWSATVDTSAVADGTTELAARAVDRAGNAHSEVRTVTVANSQPPPGSSGDIVVQDPTTTRASETVGRGRNAEWGPLSVVLYAESGTARRGAFVRSADTGQTSYVELPADAHGAWSNADYVMSSARDLWVLAGTGPIHLRHYRFSGSPLPTSAELVSVDSFGDADSKAGHVAPLRSGALIAVWHQRGFSGPQGIRVAYLRPGMATQTTALSFMPTRASRQVVAQHPADDSVWLFNSTDAWGSLGAAHLTETPDGLRVDWTDAYYISEQKHGANGPDPEHPDLAVNVDPSTATIALAYQSRTRKLFSSDPFLAGSQPVVARVPASGPLTFSRLPVYVERISSLALTVGAGATWLAYRPIDESALTADDIHVSVDRGAGWESPRDLGTLVNRNARIGYGVSRPEFSALLQDGRMRLFLPDQQ